MVESFQGGERLPEKTSYDLTFAGLENRGANNCFLNVCIQSMWHLASFRNNFLTCMHHKHSDRELVLRRKRSLLHKQL